jgi:hypothetical protein
MKWQKKKEKQYIPPNGLLWRFLSIQALFHIKWGQINHSFWLQEFADGFCAHLV